ncbi:hypothetical protein UFOVP1573_45 [uncultured Caudovirales phage]|uniref:Gp6 domain containing protein n=1 Tax=uncultured Caudovirales phage TaxID=2100421 RepID=A0A6J7XRF9_9CAUD|nr:hypothetical protein UFOVP1126_15 [uncultured Caudovirales phage]CAB4215383.1 hypothetical protein UFOVP1485_15 [uncultured Caudovirales phage]CAB5230606.1 hypothetical protein UFOVP1573_45 [uncultured Caudovirales phage]
MSYATLAQFKQSIGIGTADTTDDSALQSVLDATDALIDNYCDRRQGFGTATETRYYTASDWSYVLTDDIVSITTLQTDDNGDNTYETTWAAGTDYVLAPSNNALDGWPYTEIDTSVTAPRAFPSGVYRGVKVLGVFGWPSVPSAVVQSAVIQASAVWSSRTSPFGVIGSQELGGILRQTRALHPEAQVLLEAYRKREGLAR